MATHLVTNQVPPFTGGDLLTTDPALGASVARWADPARLGDLEDLARIGGTEQARAWAEVANRVTPLLRTHDRTGARIDEVEFHPSWHALMEVAVGHGLTAGPWTAPAGSGAHAARAAGFLVWSQVEQGHVCPISMTYAAAPALRSTPDVGEVWIPRIASRTYDFGLRPARDKAGSLAGMGMTEKQGGSDVRANSTVATPAPGGPVPGAAHRLTGHKWFCSAPMSDAFLVLARSAEGLSCFLVPRVLEDGTRNAFAIQRLKDKVGNRSNASAEVEFDGTWGSLVGEAGRGIRTILDMVAATRLDCVLGSAATMRDALARAVHHARHRSAFGAELIDQPLMRNVLADLALESEAATLLGMRLAHAIDEEETEFARLAVALGKFWVTKRTAPMVAEAMECLGGNGYVEENGLGRLYREAPLNSIWEGSGNVNALDVLRAVRREPAAVAAFDAELSRVLGRSEILDAAVGRARCLIGAAGHEDAPWHARHLVEGLALTLQAALMVEHAEPAHAEAFLTSRLGGERGWSFGSMTTIGSDTARAIVDRAVQV